MFNWVILMYNMSCSSLLRSSWVFIYGFSPQSLQLIRHNFCVFVHVSKLPILHPRSYYSRVKGERLLLQYQNSCRIVFEHIFKVWNHHSLLVAEPIVGLLYVEKMQWSSSSSWCKYSCFLFLYSCIHFSLKNHLPSWQGQINPSNHHTKKWGVWEIAQNNMLCSHHYFVIQSFIVQRSLILSPPSSVEKLVPFFLLRSPLRLIPLSECDAFSQTKESPVFSVILPSQIQTPSYLSGESREVVKTVKHEGNGNTCCRVGAPKNIGTSVPILFYKTYKFCRRASLSSEPLKFWALKLSIYVSVWFYNSLIQVWFGFWNVPPIKGKKFLNPAKQKESS